MLYRKLDNYETNPESDQDSLQRAAHSTPDSAKIPRPLPKMATILSGLLSKIPF
jgi:hypothetical protein